MEWYQEKNNEVLPQGLPAEELVFLISTGVVKMPASDPASDEKDAFLWSYMQEML